MNFNYNHLLYFYTTVNSGSLKNAAQSLNLAPSTVSEQISELENYFGKDLMRKEKGKIILTEHGQKAYQFARTIFTAGERLHQTLVGHTELAGTTIEIGVNNAVTEIFEQDLFLPLFRDPNTKIRLRVGELATLAEDLFSYSIDIVITDREINRLNGTKCEIIQKPTYSLVVGPQFRDKNFSLKDLNEIPFIHYTVYSGIKWEVDQYFMKHGFKPKLIGEVDDIGLMKTAVLDGLCFAILPSILVKKEIKNEEMILLGTLPEIQPNIYAYYHEKEPAKNVRTVLEHLRSVKA